MTGLIYKDAVIELTWEEPSYTDPLNVLTEVRDRIKELPTIDAVPVVRCRDCRFGKETCGNIECEDGGYHGYDWFCPNGKRKEK